MVRRQGYPYGIVLVEPFVRLQEVENALMEVIKHANQHCLSRMYLSHWKPLGVSERMWSVDLDASISGESQTLGGHSCRPSE